MHDSKKLSSIQENNTSKNISQIDKGSVSFNSNKTLSQKVQILREIIQSKHSVGHLKLKRNKKGEND